ncbi:MAG: NAD-dependent epimerase/dehydratase family protein [Syntrophomonas sp.]|nr:NAD-dependent epimerase/dehydratase family protein [Syntrophomonas sp.]
MKYFLTGAAGFIGYHVARRLLERNEAIIGIDNLNDYYDPALKKARLEELKKYDKFSFHKNDICDYEALSTIFKMSQPDKVCHLAAQAGVRYSLHNPFAYQKSNLEGFLNILECCRQYPVDNLVYASSSSIYGDGAQIPFSTKDSTDRPLSLYAATKKANELMAYSYHHLYGLKTCGLRFFTVYGPWGRPDMAYFKFTRAISEDKAIDVYNYGQMERDFTYIEDIAAGVLSALDKNYDWEIFNLGNSQPNKLGDLIAYLEKKLCRKAIINYLPMQAGDVRRTYADIEDSREKLGFNPSTSLEEGLDKFVEWYRSYYQIKNC